MSEIMELENKSNQVLVFEEYHEYLCSPGVNPVELIRSRIRNVEGDELPSASAGTEKQEKKEVNIIANGKD